MADPDPDPNSSLGDIEDDLTTIENQLNGSSRRGRAIFNSVNSMLGSLRVRLQQSTATNAAAGGVHDEERSSALTERLQTAELAHTNRVPLNLLRNTETMERRSRERESLLRSVTHGSKTDLAAEEGDDADPSAGRRRPSLQRSSDLVASRRRLEEVETLDLHASGAGLTLLSPVVETQKEDLDASDHLGVVETATGFETPLLFSRASLKSFSTLSQRNVSGSVVLKAAPELDKQCAVYSWGASHSLHDDETERAPADSLVTKSERLGRVANSVSVACGPNHSAVATQQGELFICGDNTTGAVAPFQKDQAIIVRPTLVEALGQTVVRQVSCGWDHTAAVSSTGAVLTWGSNEKNQLGHFVAPSAPTKAFCLPKAMSLGPGTRAASVACGDQFTMVLTTRLSMMVCGKPEIASHGKTLPSQLPVLVGLPIASVAAGKDHATVLTVFGIVYAWGSNTSGCCGRPFPKNLSSPVPIVMPSEGQIETPLGTVHIPKIVRDGTTMHIADDVAVVHAACGHDHTVLVTRSGQLLVCGSNAQGQLSLSPTEKPIVDHVEYVSHPQSGKIFTSAETGHNTTLLLDDTGDVWQVKDGNLSRVLSGKSILTIAAGGKQCIALSHGSGVNRQFNASSSDDANADHIAKNLESLVKQMLDEVSSEDETMGQGGEELVKRLEELLKNPSVLNSLFLNPSELDHLCQEIYSIENVIQRQAIATAVEKSILEGLESLETNDARMKYPSSVRCLLHYIRFFDFNEDESVSFDPLGTCISALCETLLNLPFEGFKNLLAWLSIYTPDLFVRMLVDPLLSQLNKALLVEVDENGVQHSKVARRAAPMIVGVLKWLHATAQRKHLATPESFYCKAIAGMPLEDLYEDLHAKKEAEHQPHGLLLSESPFLIPPSKKRDLLQIESQVSMVRVAMQNSTPNEGTDTVSIEPFFVVEIDREHLLEETFDAIKNAEASDLRRKLRIKFKGEEGVDAGGVTREFFALVSEELFDVSSALWTRRFGEEITWFNSDCTWDDEGYDRVGVLVGLALYNGVLLDVHFPEAVYRKMLEEPLGLEDLVDKELRKGLQQLLDYEGGDVENVFCLTFEITWMDLGKEQKVELKPGGSNIEVTSDNREEYVLLYVKWLLVDSIQPQWEAFISGVDRIMDGSSLTNLFTPKELELLVVGTPELDFAALEANAEYEGGFDTECPVVQNLWKFVKEADRETQRKFLKFSTGNCKAPIGGLGALNFKVQRAGADSPQLPTSHTCFNTLLLPDYGDDFEKLKERLGRAVLECEGFGLE